MKKKFKKEAKKIAPSKDSTKSKKKPGEEWKRAISTKETEPELEKGSGKPAEPDLR